MCSSNVSSKENDVQENELRQTQKLNEQVTQILDTYSYCFASSPSIHAYGTLESSVGEGHQYCVTARLLHKLDPGNSRVLTHSIMLRMCTPLAFTRLEAAQGLSLQSNLVIVSGLDK